jgi:dynein regulatry complex protein 1
MVAFYQFQAVWQTNFDEAMSMLDKVLNIDKILHEQQLGLQWTEPDVKLLQRKELPSYKSAMELMNNSSSPTKVTFIEKGAASFGRYMQGYGAHYTLFTENLFEDVKQERAKQFHEKKFLQHILYTIADKAEFLVENKLLDLIEPYSDEQKALVRLDNVFSVRTIKIFFK